MSYYIKPNFFCRSITERFSSRWMADNLRFIRLTGWPWNRRKRVSRKIPLRFTRRVKLYNSELPCSPSFFLTSIAMTINNSYFACVSGTTGALCGECAVIAFFFIFTGTFAPITIFSFHQKIMDGCGWPGTNPQPVGYPLLVNQRLFGEGVVRSRDLRPVERPFWSAFRRQPTDNSVDVSFQCAVI